MASPVLLALLLVVGGSLVSGDHMLSSYSLPLEADDELQSPSRNTRDVPLSSYGRLGEREDDNDTETATTTAPEVETTEASTVVSQVSTTVSIPESTKPQPDPNNGPFGFGITLPNGIPFLSKGSQPSEDKTKGQPAESSQTGSPGFQLQVPKFPSFGFGRR